MASSSLFYAAALAVAVALTGLSSYGIYRFAKAYRPHPAWTFLAWLAPLAALAVVYFALYPIVSAYLDDYFEVTGMELPPGAEFLLRSATYPDRHGDYTSVAVVRMEGRYYTQLRERLMDGGWVDGSPVMHSDLSDEAQNALRDQTFVRKLEAPPGDSQDQSEHYFVGFRADEKTVVVERSSS